MECGTFVSKYGDYSYAVKLIQERLSNLGYLDKKYVDGHFGDNTRMAVVKYQKDKKPLPSNLNSVRRAVWKLKYWDGIVGPQTWYSLWPNKNVYYTFSLVKKIKYSIINKRSPGYLLSECQKKLIYGCSEDEVENNLITINFLNKDIDVHRLHRDQFERVNNRIREYEKKHKLEQYVPSKIMTFSWRLTRGNVTLSNHSFGIAIDLDWHNNPITNDVNEIKKWELSKNRLPAYVIKAFVAEGAAWGGNQNNLKEYHHFQF